ncbi:S9 family peptidase [Maricaulis sp. CAU 1757]
MNLRAFGIATLVVSGASLWPSALAQDTPGIGGASGADLSIEAVEPGSEPVRVGLAGQDPADIGRYILANGAGSAALSPDGNRIAFTRSLTGAPQLWVVSATGGQPQQLTFGNGVGAFDWLPDSSGLLYSADNDGNERPAYYRISAEGDTEAVVLPATENGFRVFGDFLGEDRIVYASTERNGLDFDVYVAPLDQGEPERVYEGNVYARSVSPDGRWVVITEAVGEDSDTLALLDLTSGETSLVSAPDPRANHTDGGLAWSDDSAALYLATNRDSEFAALTRMDLATRAFETLAATDADAGDVGLCGRDDRYLVWTTNHDGFERVHVRDRTEGTDTMVPDLPEGRYGLSCGDSHSRLAILANGWRTPGNILLLDLATSVLSEVFSANFAGLDPDRLVRPESIRIEARDGVTLQGLLYRPDAASGAAPYPVLFRVHGGPTAQSVARFNAVAQYYVDRGIAVFEPNVRGSTGFGRTFVTLDDREKRLDSVRDLIDMLDHLRADPGLDADRAVVSGGSYGGYMVNAVLAAYPDAFDAGISAFGVADWVTALEIASPALKASDRIEYGDISDPQWRDFYTENSPIRQADRIRVPVLYSHGVMDPRIDIGETEIMVTTLRGNGVEAEFLRFPDEGHGWSKLANQLFYYRREADFVERQLGMGDDATN